MMIDAVASNRTGMNEHVRAADAGSIAPRAHNLPEHLRGLLNPAAYPHAVTQVELVETHMSWVFLTGERAYKVKRPILYPFADFRELAQRERLCREELRLNRRFAPGLYESVERVTLRDGSAVIGGQGEAIEYAVRMLQFDRSQELDRLVVGGRVDAAELRQFGRELALAHEQLPADTATPAGALAAAVGEAIDRNMRECRSLANAAGAAVDSLCDQVGGELDRRFVDSIGALSSRALARRVRECHGDLHLANIVRIDGRLVPFDGLEFDPAFRWIDVADEVAFLYADLCGYGRMDLAYAFVDGYVEVSGDFNLWRVLDLFAAHRAVVRAKVMALRARSAPGTASEERALALARCAHYLAAAAKSLAGRPRRLVLITGLSGAGKSALTVQIAPRLDAVRISADIERRRVAGLEADARTASRVGMGLYSTEVTDRTYARLARCAADVLEGGHSVLIDATLLRSEQRRAFAMLAARLGVECVLVRCEAPPEVLEARIRERLARATDPSEATLAVLEWQRGRDQPPQPGEGCTLVRIDTTSSTAAADAFAAITGAPRIQR
jgi:hypothetical protein